MKFFNTLSRQKEEFVPIDNQNVKIYACGPTVYNLIHIGNARPLCVFDVLRRYMEYKGLNVKFVQNFTDIDDKIIKKGNEEGMTYKEVSEKYIEEFWKDVKGMNIREATVHPKATENIDEMIDIIKTLEAKGYAYAVNGDVYFRTKKFAEYGKLSHQPLEDLESGARIDVSDQKEDPMDFVLWKNAKPGEPYWETPWGNGRPGWHIECSAMAKRYLGESIDIHCGGQDLVFPHHENEIAQSECCNGVQFSKYWLHNGFINVDNTKMSKSLGNFFTVRDVAEKYGYEPIRYLMISSHYRTPINYSVDIIEQCKSALSRLYNCRDSVEFALKKATVGTIDETLKAQFDKRKLQFEQAMEDDMNTADAIAALFDLTRDINNYIAGETEKNTLEYAVNMFDEIADILGLVYQRKDNSVDTEVEKLIEDRAKARAEKNWAESDRIRDVLKEMGIVLKDTASGVEWYKA